MSDPVTAYASRIAAGELPAGKWHRLACLRHLRDLEASTHGDFPYRFRPELAERGTALFRMFKHYKGRGFAGEPIILSDWQAFIDGSLDGWVHVRSGLRRYTHAFCEIPRGNGKSTFAAGILIKRTFLDHEPGAEGYVIATKKDQARIVFTAARQIVVRAPVLREDLGIRVLTHNLHCEATESKAEPLGADADTLDGLRPYVAIGDEIHKHASADLVEVIESGMGTRDQPLLFEITTAGASDELETVYGQHLSLSHQVLEGVVDLPSWFAFIACADPEDDWTQEATWIKANPNWGVSVKPDFVRAQFVKAIANPAEQPKFKRLYLGLKVQALDAYFSIDDWRQCPTIPSDDELRRFPSWIGLDLSSAIDITAAVHVWRMDRDELAVRCYFWLPAAGLEDRGQRDRFGYADCVASGHLRLTEGNTIDRTKIRADVTAIAKAWKVKAVCFDPWQAAEMTQAMQDEDRLTLIEVPQRYQHLSAPTKSLQGLILKRRIRHDHSPIMRWNISNAKIREDGRGNVMLCKRRSRGRIDGAQALVTAQNQVETFSSKRSTYEQGGLFSIGGES